MTTRIAVVCPSWVGDTVMATPVLRAAATQATLTIVCRPGLQELLAGASWAADYLVGETKSTAGVFGLARRLRGIKADAAIVLPNSFRSALLPRLAGIPTRHGYRRNARGPLLTHAIKPPATRPIPAVEYYAQLAEQALGVDTLDRTLELGVTDKQRQAANDVLRDVPRPFALLCPGANKPAKRWPAQRFRAVALALAERRGLAAVATGAPEEADVIRQVTEGTKIVDLVSAGVTLGVLKAIAAESSVTITNDTGPRHIAAALGTPVVCLYGPTDARWTTLQGVREHRLLAEPFLPDELTADDYPKGCDITRIAVGDVIAATEGLLDDARDPGAATPPASPASTPPV